MLHWIQVKFGPELRCHLGLTRALEAKGYNPGHIKVQTMVSSTYDDIHFCGFGENHSFRIRKFLAINLRLMLIDLNI